MRIHLLPIVLLLSAAPLWPAAIGFEGLGDGTLVGDTYASFGIHFSNATVQAKDVSLSPLFPPAQGKNVATDLPGSPMAITFDFLTDEFSARFTWSFPLHFFVVYNNGIVQTINSTDAGQYGSTQGTANFIGADVVGGMGNPNLPFFFSNVSGIEELDIYTDIPGNSFTIDDIVANVITPEPNGFAVVAGAIALMLALVARSSVRRGGSASR